jgi:serine/threonine protein phosphatase PrpC
MAVEILAEAFTNIPEGADAESVMRAAIEQSNSAIFQMAHELPQLSNMATTIVALHLDGNIATIGHVGDSRLYRVDREGNLFRETDDHSMVAEEVRAGRMTEEQAENHPSRNVISRALGAEPTVDADLKTIMVDPGTAFLICSDGITRHVADQEIKGVLTFGGTPEEVCDYLKRLCYERGAEDNLTAVVVRVGEVGETNGHALAAPPMPEEEATVATARANFEDAPVHEMDDELLELEIDGAPTQGAAATDLEELELDPDFIDTLDDMDLGSMSESDETKPPIVPVPVSQSPAIAEETARSGEPAFADAGAGSFSMFEDSRYGDDENERPDALTKYAATAGFLILGTLLGLGLYHFLFAPKPQPGLPALTEMQSANQQLSAFEENRRTVDRMPGEAITRFGADPRDAEDYFLVGRAHLLLGQYAEAKRAFGESKNRIAAGDVDQNNRKTIETEIAIAMAVLNDTTVQVILREQLAGQTGAANANTARTP